MQGVFKELYAECGQQALTTAQGNAVHLDDGESSVAAQAAAQGREGRSGAWYCMHTGVGEGDADLHACRRAGHRPAA